MHFNIYVISYDYYIFNANTHKKTTAIAYCDCNTLYIIIHIINGVVLFHFQVKIHFIHSYYKVISETKNTISFFLQTRNLLKEKINLENFNQIN
jgi:hypothetical protein